MKRHALLGAAGWLILMPQAQAQKTFTLEQVMSAPFPSNLTAAKKGNRLAWTLNQEGRRNIWVAEGPAFSARQLTNYSKDDGQELSDLSFPMDVNAIVYVRGEGKNAAGQVPNPTSNPEGAEQSVWTVAWSGGEPKRVDAGHSPEISTRGTIAYLKDGQIWIAPLDGTEKLQQLAVRGQNYDQHWSPDGSRLAFTSARADHRFIGVYDVAAKTVQFVSPSVDLDGDAAWSPDGKRIAFPYMADDTGGGVLNWAADGQLVLASEEDGWQHLYALSVEGGKPRLLTPGNCEVEQWSFTTDKKTILFNSNCNDIDRRHLWSVNITADPAVQRTRGEGMEWSPVVLSDEHTFAYLASDATHPARAIISRFAASAPQILAPEIWPKNFPSDRLAVPQQVLFKSADGLEIHAQLFSPKDAKPGEKRAAVIFLHGGPMRQMLLGWHYMYYYSNAYAMNQYLASRGYIVLALNYRSGIGYGRAFREAPGRAGRGAAEYQDVAAAGKYLQSRNDVDAKRIGLWGGSYGGYLTALGLGRNSDLFAAGVDLHGVHDWPTDNWDGKNIPADLTKLAHDSSPVTSVNTWKSPVLFIHGDDDRNVYFTQTVDLVARLREKGVEIEQLVFPDEVHDFLLHRDWLAAYHAASDFFDKHLQTPGK